MNIVIANSIGRDKKGNYIIHSPSRWSESVKSRFHWFAYYPWELAYLSSLLKKRTEHRISFIDGCLMRMGRKSYQECILEKKPDVLIMESATRMIEENIAMALDIKKQLCTKLIFVGQHASAFPEQLKKQGIDEICIGEYEFTVLELLLGKQKDEILGLYPNPRRPLLDINELPWPEDSDVSRLDYGLPGEPSSEFREIQMYGSRGCPGDCNFCVARHVYYNTANWRPRKISSIIDEIIYLKRKYSAMQGVFFDEEVHNGSKKFILELTEAIQKAELNDLKFEAMCDVRFLDEEILLAMKKAGYYKIRIGIESASQPVMQTIQKAINIEKVKGILKLCKKIDLKTYGTFTFGALNSNSLEDEKTIKLIKNLLKQKLLDNLQLSICTPQPGTPFYKSVKEKKFLRKDAQFCKFDGGNFSMVDYPDYRYQEIESMKNRALLIRDHLYLKGKKENGSFLSWIKSIFIRYGFTGFFVKLIKRVVIEAKYQFVKWSR